MKTNLFGVLNIGVILAALSSGCGDCTGASKDADAFIRDPNNQQCETADDCVVENVACSEMTTSWCGQVSLSAVAAASKDWAELKSGLDDCPGECAVCGGALIANCEQGLCRRPAD